MRWLRNALLGLMKEAVRTELTAQRATELAHVTELTSVLHKATDELSHALSREAMRKARAAAAARKEGEETQVAAQPLQTDGLTPKQIARLRWHQMQQSQTRSG